MVFEITCQREEIVFRIRHLTDGVNNINCYIAWNASIVPSHLPLPTACSAERGLWAGKEHTHNNKNCSPGCWQPNCWKPAGWLMAGILLTWYCFIMFMSLEMQSLAITDLQLCFMATIVWQAYYYAWLIYGILTRILLLLLALLALAYDQLIANDSNKEYSS